MGSATKENDGKAARQKLARKLNIIFGTFVSVLIVVTILKYRNANDSDGNHALRRNGDGLHMAFHNPVVNMDPYILETPDEQLKEASVQNDIDRILSGDVNLVDIRVTPRFYKSSTRDKYTGVKANFCKLNWDIHKKDPSKTPMFRDLVGNSSCESHISMDLSELISKLHQYDKTKSRKSSTTTTTAHTIPPTGFVFHESRCGSTLVANSLAAFSPSTTRVYSESGPPLAALGSCGESFSKCDRSRAAALFKDVVYLMGRSNNLEESHLFFKIQSIGSRFIGVMREAFPDTPWIFVHREPVQVMMSHFAVGNVKNVNCLRHRNNPPKVVKDLLNNRGLNVREVTNEVYCAAHLATLCQSALEESISSQGLGQLVDYANLPDHLIDNILPHLFKVYIGPTEKQNILDISTHYSKGRGERAHEWIEDSKKKEEAATNGIKSASYMLLADIYQEMTTTQ